MSNKGKTSIEIESFNELLETSCLKPAGATKAKGN